MHTFNNMPHIRKEQIKDFDKEVELIVLKHHFPSPPVLYHVRADGDGYVYDCIYNFCEKVDELIKEGIIDKCIFSYVNVIGDSVEIKKEHAVSLSENVVHSAIYAEFVKKKKSRDSLQTLIEAARNIDPETIPQNVRSSMKELLKDLLIEGLSKKV